MVGQLSLRIQAALILKLESIYWKQSDKALNMTGAFLTRLKEKFFEEIIIDVLFADGPTRSGIDLILVIWRYIIKSTTPRVAITQKVILSLCVHYAMMKSIVKNRIERQGKRSSQHRKKAGL
jgi:hypothetical protein